MSQGYAGWLRSGNGELLQAVPQALEVLMVFTVARRLIFSDFTVMQTLLSVAYILRAVAERVPTARLSTGARVLDPSDFRQWLIELSEKAEKAESPERFFAQLRKDE